MITSLPQLGPSLTVHAQARRTAITWWLWFVGMLGFTSLIGIVLLRGTPSLAAIAWLLFAISAIAVLYQPRFGVYIIIGFSLAGDSVLSPWYPFVKNLSSFESLMYVGRATSFSPAEIFIAITFISWLGRALMQRKLNGYTGPLFWPTLTFSAFITFGLVYGLLQHGNMTIALWEVRTIYYLPAMLILTSNLLETREHVNQLIWTIVIALFIDGVAGASFVVFTLNFDLHALEAIAEHSYSIHLNTLFVLTVGVWLYRGSRVKRIILPLMLPIIALSYFSNQRRASYITLMLAFMMIGFLLYRVNRKMFWMLVPAACLLGVVYLAAFWNSSGGIGGPARAVRSEIAPVEGSRDDASNLYRVIENLNTSFTIKQKPLTGLGFGNKFYIVAQMPDISFFIWWEYITHNSIMWIWMQTGVGGFVAMLFMIGMSVIVGIRALARMPGGDLSAFTLMATLYIVMHFVYAYVDMSWEAQSMLYVGTMMGLINCIERIVARPVPVPRQRWPWQRITIASPGGAA